MTNKEIQSIINHYPEFKNKLFCRGFLLTSAQLEDNEYPFYGNWAKEKIDIFQLFVHPKQKYYVHKMDDTFYALIGHAYNPIDGEYNEDIILQKLANKKSDNIEIDYLNQLTGIFTLIRIGGGKINIYGDATCMQSTFYGCSKGYVYVSTHTNLIGDVAHLKWDDYVERLSRYRFFGMLGNSLPGDLTQFSEIKRLTPNFCAIYDGASWRVERFYMPHTRSLDNDQIANKVIDLLHGNMSLIAKKWEKPAISCTGGCDSKTTLACTKGLYGKYSYFSYISNPSEEVDAKAAKVIINTLGQKHQTYIIPSQDAQFPLIEKVRAVIDWNTGDITPNNHNDVRKRRFFEDTVDFDVEVKSWVSEVGRAYYSKRFNGRKEFGKKPTPRKCTAMYKFFLHDRKLVRETDKVFADFLKKYFQQDKKHPVDWQEQLFWEFRCPSWNGLVITGEHRYSFDITIPYNNRLILELLLSARIDDRINDTIYKIIRQKTNPLIDETGISVINVKHTNTRAKAENLYYWITTHLPF